MKCYRSVEMEKSKRVLFFKLRSNGNDSGRDSWVYNYQDFALRKNAEAFAIAYNSELDRYISAGKPEDLDTFLTTDERTIKWTRNAKRDIKRLKRAAYSSLAPRTALYRPFSRHWLYPGKLYNKEVAQLPQIFPKQDSDNCVIALTSLGSDKPFMVMASREIVDLHLVGAGAGTQCFGFYTYTVDGTHRQENITDWSLDQYRAHYGDKQITKWDIFHSTYALLHDPEYRTRYAANLKRELPRFPFPPDLHAFAAVRQAPHGTPHRLREAARIPPRRNRAPRQALDAPRREDVLL